jgi:hypothetical protein
MMSMSDYLKEIEYATRHLIPVIWEERKRLRELAAVVASLTRRVEHGYRQSESVAANAEDADDVGLATGIYWETYFGDDKECYHKDKERVSLAGQVASHQFSAYLQAGSLLHYAKHGISQVHGGRDACPPGRQVTTSLTLKDVIWQGRNQSSHWEVGKPHAPVVSCFNTLATEVDPKFANYKTQNLSLDLVELLGWTDFDKFHADMLLLK